MLHRVEIVEHQHHVETESPALEAAFDERGDGARAWKKDERRLGDGFRVWSVAQAEGIVFAGDEFGCRLKERLVLESLGSIREAQYAEIRLRRFHSAEKGEVLYFKRRKKGFRAYLAVKAGFDVPEVLGSRSTFLRGRIGTALFKGTILRIQDPCSTLPVKTINFPEEYIPNFSVHEPICVLLGPQDHYYTHRGIETFLSSGYTISSQSDRMAYRLEGAPIEIARRPGIITEPIPRGCIQVPGDGQPIILLRDAQVTGGYAKIASVTAVDMNRLAQMRPGDKIHFQKVDRKEAINLLNEENKKKENLKALLSR